MARSNAVWAIDIGHCALKALRCTIDENDQIVADAFDYVEYPKILGQPEANADELVKDALTEFLSRNEVKHDKLAIAVSGQQGLARFFKPPPVDAKVLPDIVKYEARQQIPFPLEDVVWDFQQIGGVEVDGFTLDAEVGLFAMKRDQVFRAIKPFTDAELELDLVQLGPLCAYNFICHELLHDVPSPEDIDPDDPPESVIVLAMGTETTDLVITNGHKLWQRSIPIGGNHFTKQLTKELKLTFAKAEHLKRNARQADDPKRIFQAMRPVFNDLVTEIQRSLTFFGNIDRQAKLGRVVLLGNAAKLPGLRQYLTQKLDQKIVKIDKLTRLGGSSVLTAATFKENLPSFAGCIGLCLQGLGEAKLSTNLLPREFIVERMIREKKPWVVASVAIVLLAFVVHFAFTFWSYKSVHDDYAEYKGNNLVSWSDARQEVDNAVAISTQHLEKDRKLVEKKEQLIAVGQEVVGSGERRVLWLELMKAINESLPRDERFEGDKIPDPKTVPFKDRELLYIDAIESEFFPDLTAWYTPAIAEKHRDEVERERYNRRGNESPGGAAADAGTAEAGTAEADAGDEGVDVDAEVEADAAPVEADVDTDVEADAGADADAADTGDAGPVEGTDEAVAGDPLDAPPGVDAGDPAAADDDADDSVELPGPQGPGWVIEIRGRHFHNSSSTLKGGVGKTYVRNTLVKNLMHGSVILPTERRVPLPLGGEVKIYPNLPVKISAPPKYRQKSAGGNAVVTIDGREIDLGPHGSPESYEKYKELIAPWENNSLGVDYVVLVEEDPRIKRKVKIPNPNYAGSRTNEDDGGISIAPDRGGEPAEPDEEAQPQYFEADVYDFKLQFVWQHRLSDEHRAKLEGLDLANSGGGDTSSYGAPAATGGSY